MYWWPVSGCMYCLQGNRWHIILDRSSALETRTTMGIQLTHVQWWSKVPGGTLIVTTPTWTVVTWDDHTRRGLTVWIGFTGKVTSTHWNSLKWRWGSSNFIDECPCVIQSDRIRHSSLAGIVKISEMKMTSCYITVENSKPAADNITDRQYVK